MVAEEVGLDVFAAGEHHNPPFVPSSPTTMLGHIGARTNQLVLSTATTLITTNDPVKFAENYALLHRLWREDVVDWEDGSAPIEELCSVSEGGVADRSHVAYRRRVRNADGAFLVEQQAYYSVEDGVIAWMRVLCSGYRPVGDTARP